MSHRGCLRCALFLRFFLVANLLVVVVVVVLVLVQLVPLVNEPLLKVNGTRSLTKSAAQCGHDFCEGCINIHLRHGKIVDGRNALYRAAILLARLASAGTIYRPARSTME